MADNKIKNKMPIPDSVDEIEKYMKNRIGLGDSFDLGVRKLKVLRKDVHIYFVNGLTDTQFIIEIVEELVAINDNEKLSTNLSKIVENRLVHQSVAQIKTMDELVDQVLSGLIVVVMEGVTHGLVIDVRSYPGRTPMEPDTEKVVRGSRDGYVENIIINTALTRRRIRDERLRFEIMRVGERSKTDVAIGYIKDVANPDLINIIRKEIAAIDIDGITMADKTIEEFLLKQGFNPFPLVRYTERADVAATHLLEGHVLIFVDTSPSVMISPTTYFHHLQHAEEYRQSPAVGTFIRWIRFLGVASSLFLLPLWFLFVLEPSLLPESIAFIGPNEETNIPVILQLFLAEIGIELLRIAAIHTPTPLSTAMGLIAAVLIGQIAIDVGLFVPEVILYVSLAAIGTYTTPSYELSIANKLFRLLFLVLVAIFHTPGFVVGITLFILFLANMKPLNTPYLWPFIPFHPKALWRILVRASVPGSSIRPSIVHTTNRYKQPPKNSSSK
ncbi:spore germination protein [Cytobacillus solani]|uniref:Stage V sporulation protein AF n=2 Tax=Cytobacillus solani TaxID=1637975 RepID=A0A0Q3VIQ0_9BACI|nr:spore germination protein [Cytobacillus solani]KOP83303.1 stage V sporulation protein AF [Bacillus sp. FJAT-21945]KQL20330.1 stage V sporulation protein AF [Cytobacillus solani]USK53588.1 spore germination protein [Cytobacillus solani]